MVFKFRNFLVEKVSYVVSYFKKETQDIKMDDNFQMLSLAGRTESWWKWSWWQEKCTYEFINKISKLINKSTKFPRTVKKKVSYLPKGVWSLLIFNENMYIYIYIYIYIYQAVKMLSAPTVLSFNDPFLASKKDSQGVMSRI